MKRTEIWPGMRVSDYNPNRSYGSGVEEDYIVVDVDRWEKPRWPTRDVKHLTVDGVTYSTTASRHPDARGVLVGFLGVSGPTGATKVVQPQNLIPASEGERLRREYRTTLDDRDAKRQARLQRQEYLMGRLSDMGLPHIDGSQSDRALDTIEELIRRAGGSV